MKYTPLRMHMVAVMLANPHAEWTANSMQDAIAAKVDAPTSAVLDTFYLFLNERLTEPVPYQRALTVRISTDHSARTMLDRLLVQWRAEGCATKESGHDEPGRVGPHSNPSPYSDSRS